MALCVDPQAVVGDLAKLALIGAITAELKAVVDPLFWEHTHVPNVLAVDPTAFDEADVLLTRRQASRIASQNFATPNGGPVHR